MIEPVGKIKRYKSRLKSLLITSRSVTQPTASGGSSRKNFPPEPKDWTVLYYMAGNNDIAQDLIKKTARFERSGSDEHLNVVVQLAQPQDSPYPGVNRFKMEKAPVSGISSVKNYLIGKFTGAKDLPRITSPRLEELGNVPMNDPQTLKDFVSWGMKNYPAEHYCVMVMDHGYGFVGTVEDRDWPQKVLSLPELKQALGDAQKESGKKIDILGFDACLMQQAEVAYQLKNQADYLLASQEVEYPIGMPEGAMTQRLQEELKKGEVDPLTAGRLLAEEAAKDTEAMKTVSLVDLKQMDEVRKNTDRLAQSLLKSHISTGELKKLIHNTYNFCRVDPQDKLCTEYRDLYHFAEQLSVYPGSEPPVRKAAQEVMKSVKSAVVAQEHQGEGEINGLAVYLPEDGMLGFYDGRYTETKVTLDVPRAYHQTDWARDTQWDEWLNTLKRK